MFSKVAIVGVGLLGGSLARDLKSNQLAKTVVGVCRSAATREVAIEQNVVDQMDDLNSAVKGADLVVLATPMQAMLPLLRELAPVLESATIVTDVGSVKSSLYQELKVHCPALLKQFVFAHPIAGGEDAGVLASKGGLFNGKHVIITGTDEVDQDKVQVVSKLWQTLGATVVKMTLHEHDAIFARTSHLPHVVAYSLVNYLAHEPDDERLFEMAAAGFYDFTRIASSNAEMWRDICVTNRQQLLSALDGFQHQISLIRDKIEANDQQGILNAFSNAKAVRDAGLSNKSGAGS